MIRQRYQSYPVLHDLTNTYDKYLVTRKYIGSLQQGIVQINDKALQVLGVSGSSGQWKITDNIRFDPEIVSYELSRLREGMHSLGADFNIAMGGVLVVFEMARPEYRAIFNKLIDIFKRDRKIEAEGKLREGLKAYRDGCRIINKPELFNNALRHLNAVVEKYREAPLVYLHIGHIYHYQEKLRNFRRALENYLICFSFTEQDPDTALLAAQAAFYAGWLTAAVLGDMQTAIDMTKKSLELDPRLGEAHYHLAKIYGAFGDTREALSHLQEVLRSFDRRYCYKIMLDSDFRIIREDLKKLMYEIAEKDLADQEEWLRDQGGTLNSVLKMHAEDKLEDARRMLETNDYEQIAEVIGLLYGLKQRVLGHLEEEDFSEKEKERRRQEEEKRRAEEEAHQKAAEEARMKEELKKRIEAEMKARIEIEQRRQRTRYFIRGVIGDLILLSLAFSLGSFILYGATTGGFVLAFLTCILIIIWLWLYL